MYVHTFDTNKVDYRGFMLCQLVSWFSGSMQSYIIILHCRFVIYWLKGWHFVRGESWGRRVFREMSSFFHSFKCYSGQTALFAEIIYSTEVLRIVFSGSYYIIVTRNKLNPALGHRLDSWSNSQKTSCVTLFVICFFLVSLH